MTDLERVRGTLADHVRGRDHYLEADEWGKCKWESALEALDAHLAEDAERERLLADYEGDWNDMEAELTELREEKATAYAEERERAKGVEAALAAKVWNFESGEAYYRLKRELTELREAVREVLADSFYGDKAVMDRLRQLIDGVD